MTDITLIAGNAVTLYRTKQNGRPMPVYLEGPPGSGKSKIVETVIPDVLEEHFFPDAEPTDMPERPNVCWSQGGKVAVITEILSTVESTDIRGFAMPVKDKDTGKYETAWIMPAIVRAEAWAYAQGAKIVVFFFDELPQCDGSTQKGVVDIMLNGRIGEHGLRRTTWCVAAGNRTKDMAGANRLLSILRNRVVNYEVELPLAKMLKWATKNGMPPIIADFLEFRPDLLADIVPTKDGAFLTNRSMTQAFNLINASKRAQGITDDNVLPDDDFTMDTVTGVIGEAATVELYAYAADAANLPKIEEIIADPVKCMVPGTDQMSAQYAAAQLLKRNATQQNVVQLWTYAERLMKDMQAKIANDLLENQFGGVLFNTKIFNDWLAENRTLVNATFAR
jgi:hypothetical protein